MALLAHRWLVVAERQETPPVRMEEAVRGIVVEMVWEVHERDALGCGSEVEC